MTMTDEEKIYQIALSKIKNVGFVLWKNFIEHFGSATDLYTKNQTTLRQIHKYPTVCQEILNRAHIDESEKLLNEHKHNGINIISYFDNQYPYNLKQIASPPMFLYYKGNMNTKHLHTISIVGTRTPSQYGKNITENFVSALTEYNVDIISGLAYGIDITAHNCALQNNIRTIAVLASGLDKIYPNQHKPIANMILDHDGALISEFPLHTDPNSFNFPTRNRIIAGYSDATLVIEAGEKSGSIITAMRANDYDRDVFAVPGNINSSTSAGCNMLIRNNIAHLVTSVEDIAEIMNWTKDDTNICVQPETNYDKFDELTKNIIYIIQKHPNISSDNILNSVDIHIQRLSSIILQLELDGIIEVVQGDKYRLKR